MSNNEDLNSDINRLYNALKNNRMITARMIHAHLRTVHEFRPKNIRDSLTTLGQKKIVEVSQKAVETS